MSGDRWMGSSTPYLRPSGDAWKQEAAGAGRAGTQRVTFAGEASPPPDVAQHLALGAGETVIQRRRLILLDGHPVEIADSYWPNEVAAGTALTRPGKIRGGAVALLRDLGRTPAHVNELVAARPATPEEQVALDLPETDWVLVLTRSIADAKGDPYEVSVMIAPARSRQLNYSMKVDSDG